MKKTLSFLIFISIVILKYSVPKEKHTELNEFQLANIEALALNEDGSSQIGCYGVGSVDCPIDGSKVKTVIKK